MLNARWQSDGQTPSKARRRNRLALRHVYWQRIEEVMAYSPHPPETWPWKWREFAKSPVDGQPGRDPVKNKGLAWQKAVAAIGEKLQKEADQGE